MPTPLIHYSPSIRNENNQGTKIEKRYKEASNSHSLTY